MDIISRQLGLTTVKISIAATVPEIWMEDLKTSQASSSDTLSLGRNRGPIWDPLNFNPNISPVLGATPFPCVQARGSQVYRSSLPFPLYPYSLGAVVPKVCQKWGPVAKLGRRGLEIGHSIPLAKVWNWCHFVRHVQACPTNPVCPAPPRPPKLPRVYL